MVASERAARPGTSFFGASAACQLLSYMGWNYNARCQYILLLRLGIGRGLRNFVLSIVQRLRRLKAQKAPVLIL
jgi:hypothetical protein